MRKKLFGIFNIVDICFFLILIAGVLAVVLYFNSGGKSGDAVDVYFTVEFKEMEPGFLSKITEGGDVSDSIKGYYLGKVFSKEEKQAVSAVYDQNTNIYVEADVPGKSTVLLTVKANGTETGKDILAEGQPVKMGKEMTIKGKGFASKGYIVDLKTEKK